MLLVNEALIYYALILYLDLKIPVLVHLETLHESLRSFSERIFRYKPDHVNKTYTITLLIPKWALTAGLLSAGRASGKAQLFGRNCTNERNPQ